MPDIDDAYLETLLREHLTAELNGQLGRPTAAFFAHAVGSVPTGDGREPGTPPLRLVYPPAPEPKASTGQVGGPRRFNTWFFGLAGAALAASVAALWTAPAAFRGHAPALPVHSLQPPATHLPPEIAAAVNTPDGTASNDLAGLSSQPPMQWVQRRTLDEGTVVLDDPDHAVPARKLREQELEHRQWYDAARRAQVEMTVPHEKIKFVEMDTY